MRRFFVILLSALVVVPTALAATRATGDGVLELKAASGTVAVGKEGQPARGVLWGQMDKGKLVVVDPVVGDGQVFVSGWEKRTVQPATDLGPAITIYSGPNLHFRVTGGKYRLFFNGSGIDLTAIGVGVAYLNGDESALDAGDYAVDSGKWVPMPLFTLKPVPVAFGTQPTQAP
ncbi:MAG: hypothetical protein ACXVRJ_13705 [Gaiellaceae bacterium]